MLKKTLSIFSIGLSLSVISSAQCVLTYTGGFPGCVSVQGFGGPGMALMAMYYWLASFGSITDMAYFLAFLGF